MFKKLIPLIALLTLLGACNDNEDADRKKVMIENAKENSQSVNKPNQSDDGRVAEDTSSLPELQKILEKIDNNDYSYRKVSDNKGKRILLLMDEEGQEKYKSIFIKETDRLKIVELENDMIIFNDPIH